MRKTILLSVCLLLACLLLCAGCGKNETPAATPTDAPVTATDAPVTAADTPATATDAPAEATDAPRTAALSEIYAEMETRNVFPPMMEITGGLLMDYYGIDTADCADVLCQIAQDGLKADEVFMITAADADAVGTLYELLSAHLDARKAEMNNYLPEQYAVLEKAIFVQDGLQIVLIVSADAQALYDVYLNQMQG